MCVCDKRMRAQRLLFGIHGLLRGVQLLRRGPARTPRAAVHPLQHTCWRSLHVRRSRNKEHSRACAKGAPYSILRPAHVHAAPLETWAPFPPSPPPTQSVRAHTHTHQEKFCTTTTTTRIIITASRAKPQKMDERGGKRTKTSGPRLDAGETRRGKCTDRVENYDRR